jgi:uncharacterized membrane protein
MSEDEHEATDRPTGQTVGERIAEDLPVFTSLTTHFYRGEIDRATTWRGRLDQTTNWAVVVVAAILTWAFSGENRPHYVVLIGVFAVSAFLVMEANRYREYDVWRDRIRTLQADLMADVFAPGDVPVRDWQTDLSEELRNPAFEISFRGALNHRLRRSYLALLSILGVAWFARITVYEPQESWKRTASIFVLPGEAVVGVVAIFYAALVVLTFWSVHGTRTREFQE